MCVCPCYITHSARFTYFNWKDFTRYSPQIISETPGPFIYLHVLLLSALVIYVHIIVSPFIVMSLQEIYQVNWQQNNESLVLDMCACVVAGCTTDVGNIALFQSFAPVIPAVVCHVNPASKSRKSREREKREWERIVHWCVGMSIISWMLPGFYCF